MHSCPTRIILLMFTRFRAYSLLLKSGQQLSEKVCILLQLKLVGLCSRGKYGAGEDPLNKLLIATTHEMLIVSQQT